MTRTAAVSTRPDSDHAFAQTLALTRRGVLGRLREPAALAPSMIFPLFSAALGSSSFSKAIQAPGFPKVDSYLSFALASSLLQGMLFGSMSAATDLATDIEQGFWERLIASPVRRTAIVLGRLGSSFVIGLAQTVVFVVIFVAFGVRIHGGPLGALVLIVSSAVCALAMASLMSGFAIRSGSAEAVQGAFPLVFILMFFSSAFFPRETMTGWYRTVADLNPLSFIVEGMRQMVIGHVTAGAVVKAVVVPLAVVAVSIAFSLAMLRRRLASR